MNASTTNLAIAERVRKVLADELGREIDDDQAMLEDLGADIVRIKAIEIALEREFCMEIPSDLLWPSWTVGAVTAAVEALLIRANLA